MSSESLYPFLPASLQNAACSIHGWWLNRTRYGRGFWRCIAAAEERLTWSPERFAAFRDERLRRFVKHCYDTVPYYRRVFDDRGILPESIETLDDLARLPVLTKADVQTHYEELLSTAVPRSRRIILHTSGTTGGGLRFASTIGAIQEQWATWWRYRRLHGLQFGTWCGYFGGRSVVPVSQTKPPYWRYNFPGKQIMFSGYHISPDALPYYLEELRRRRPPWIHGYPSLLAMLSRHILDTGEELGYQPTWVTIGAENLLAQQSRLIEDAMGVAPLEHYGMAEAIANCFQCSKRKLHVDEDFAAMEFMPVAGDSSCRIIGSNLSNLATPLLRYDVGDMAQIDAARCDCGLPGRIVRSLDGRHEDYVVLRNNVRVGRMDHVFKDMVRIREAQIYQSVPGAVVVRVVRNPDYTTDDETQLLAEFRKRLGDDTDVRIDYVDKLERTARGKIRFVVSEIEQGKLTSTLQ